MPNSKSSSEWGFDDFLMAGFFILLFAFAIGYSFFAVLEPNNSNNVWLRSVESNDPPYNYECYQDMKGDFSPRHCRSMYVPIMSHGSNIMYLEDNEQCENSICYSRD